VPFNVTPVILTSEADLGLTRTFVSGFRNVQHVLKPPVVLVDQSSSPRLSGEFLAVIASLNPAAVYVHPLERGMSVYDSVQEVANIALQRALEAADTEGYILFLEDDIAFSSQFASKVADTYLGPETGFLTFYLPGDGYGFHIIDPSRFYGTQCVLFTRKAVEEIVNNTTDMMSNFMPGYDIRWSRFLAQRGFVLYSTEFSYVQHLPRTSRLHGGSTHMSHRFIP
jgi:hypothetical protein